MFVVIEQISFIGWDSCIPRTFLLATLSNQAGKGRVFYSVDNCFETGADPRNIFHKQILKIWTPCLATFYCVIPHATLMYSLKARAIAKFSNSARARSKNL